MYQAKMKANESEKRVADMAQKERYRRQEKQKVFGEFFTCVLLLWVIATLVFLAVLPPLYSSAVGKARDRYLHYGVQPRLKFQLERELRAAAAARDSIRYAILAETYTDPMDYTTVTRLLTPIFRTYPLLSKV